MIWVAMEGSDVFLLPLTADEAQELFSRCLRSIEPDTEASEKVLQKLAGILEGRQNTNVKLRLAA
jgi:hypothetical protein